MSKSIDTLVEDIYSLFGGHKCNPANAADFGEEMMDVVTTRLARAGDSGGSTLRMSNVGKPCDRALYYDVNGFDKEELLPHTKIKFLLGDIVESLLLFLAKEAGHEVTHQQEEVMVNGIKGHIDAIIDGAVIDVKSASSFAFKKFSDGTLPDNDSFGYIAQISGYKHALATERAGFLAMDKQNGTLAMYEPKEFIDVPKRIEHMKKVVATAEPPFRGFVPKNDGKSGNMKLCTECSYCGHKKTCWPEMRTFIYSTGPRYLTTVAKRPQSHIVEITK